MKRNLLLISDSRELYWFCSRKLSGRCEVLHSRLNDYRCILRFTEAHSVFCVLLDTSLIDSNSAHDVRTFVAENLDCPFFTVDSQENKIPSEVDSLCSGFESDGAQLVESPRISFDKHGKKNYLLQLEKFASLEEPVLLLGESGCGKSYAAEIIHSNSSRKNRPFIRRNIAELNPALIESELFGCVKGAYTDAMEREGLFEKAGGGTLFIDEIGELSLENQAKLLGVLDTGKYCRVGSTKEMTLRCRLIFATDADLLAGIKNHTFKKQLYWRLEKLVVKIPPLRERRDEIAPLALKFAKECGKTLSRDALDYVEIQDWPGNIRQLMFCIQRSSVLCDSKILSRKDLVL